MFTSRSAIHDSRARLISTNLLEIPCIAEPRELGFRVSSEREKQKQTEIKQRTTLPPHPHHHHRTTRTVTESNLGGACVLFARKTKKVLFDAFFRSFEYDFCRGTSAGKLRLEPVELY